MQQGVIASKQLKGFGFIKRDGQQKDLFFHSTDVNEPVLFDALEEGNIVSFDVDETGEKGPRAINVTFVSKA